MIIAVFLLVAAADPALEEAKHRFGQAKTEYDLAHFDDALADFEAAYKAKPLPAFLFNIGQCHFQLKHFDRAVFEFDADTTPGYHIEYITHPQHCGSGLPVDVRGTAWLQVRLHPAQAHTGQGGSSVGGRSKTTRVPPRCVRPGGSASPLLPAPPAAAAVRKDP